MKKYLTFENTKLARIPGLVPLLEKIAFLPTINRMWSQAPNTTDLLTLVNSSLEQFNIKVNCESNDLNLIPEKGPVIIVANHPFGGIEGLALASLLLQKRKDVKILAN